MTFARKGMVMNILDRIKNGQYKVDQITPKLERITKKRRMYVIVHAQEWVGFLFPLCWFEKYQ